MSASVCAAVLTIPVATCENGVGICVQVYAGVHARMWQVSRIISHVPPAGKIMALTGLASAVWKCKRRCVFRIHAVIRVSRHLRSMPSVRNGSFRWCAMAVRCDSTDSGDTAFSRRRFVPVSKSHLLSSRTPCICPQHAGLAVYQPSDKVLDFIRTPDKSAVLTRGTASGSWLPCCRSCNVKVTMVIGSFSTPMPLVARRSCSHKAA